MTHAGRLGFTALFLVALSLRAAVLIHPHPVDIDEARYLIAAHHLRSGAGYSDWRGPEIDIHPLHPALIAILGESPGTLEARGRAVTFACSLLFLWPLGVLAWRLGGPKAAALCLLLAATHPWLIRSSASIQPESLYVLLTAVAMVVLWPTTTKEIPGWRWALAGALYGLAYLARPEGFLVGFVGGGIVLFRSDVFRRERLFRFVTFAAALLIFASPYLLFLRSATGGWTVTGKTAELFFVGQARYDSGGIPPDASTYVSLMKRWGGVVPFIEANPGVVVTRAARNAAEIGILALPRALGPLGLAGVLGCAAFLLRRNGPRHKVALVISPTVTLLLTLLTYRNDRVIASVLPFVFVASAGGLAASAERLDLFRGRRFAWTCTAIAAAVCCAWLPLAMRVVRSQVPDAPLDRRAASSALQMAGGAGGVASNNPALSFYLGDPALFGPAGHYTPLPWIGSCQDVAIDLRERDARVAVLDGQLDRRLDGLGSDECPLREAMAIEDRVADRRISILAWR